MANSGGNVLPRIEKAEHIGPTDTGDNIEAKRVALYAWDSVGSQWTRATSSSLIPFAYDAATKNYVDNTPKAKMYITTGTNASAGTGTLSGGTATISTTAVTANSLIFLTDTASTLTNVGVMSVTAKTAGTSFTVTSTNALDSSTFNWIVIN